MATVPRFALPRLHSSPRFDFDATKQKPQIHIKKPSSIEEQEAYSLKSPSPHHQRPRPLRTKTSPPDSPTWARAYTMESSDMRQRHDSGAVSPPPTPTATSHSKSNSVSSIATSLSNLRRGDSTSSRLYDTGVDEAERPGSVALRAFPFSVTDYEIELGDKGKKKLLGSGLWSDVYLARPCLPKPQAIEQPAPLAGADMTPPITPVKSRTSSLSKGNIPQMPPAYAIKVPASRSAKQVLATESKVLSYLSRFPDVASHVVPFYGQDSRNEALILQAMDSTLESWLQQELNALPESQRAAKLAETFPVLALNLLDGLAWLQERGCVHADIKPSNILLSPTSSLSTFLYSDFSSATLSSLPTPDSPTTPLGGGTWDFLDPILVSKGSSPATPSASSDLWSLAITLLFLVIGTSPFDCAGTNVYRRRELIKQGIPLAYANYGDDAPRNMKRLAALSRAMDGFDVKTWFARVLDVGVGKRASLEEWRDELRNAC